MKEMKRKPYEHPNVSVRKFGENDVVSTSGFLTRKEQFDQDRETIDWDFLSGGGE